MPFPDLQSFPRSEVGPYEKQMGETIAGLLTLFRKQAPDAESSERVHELVANPSRWSGGHAVFDEVRRRFLQVERSDDSIRQAQYLFEESCCQAVFNATSPQAPFDPGSPFFVAGLALDFAKIMGVPTEEVVHCLSPTRAPHR